jgi:hypothetical protein
MEDKDKGVSGIECGDFLVFNFLLLLIIPTNCSITLRICIAFGCIVIVQLADLCKPFKLSFSELDGRNILGKIGSVITSKYCTENKIHFSSKDKFLFRFDKYALFNIYNYKTICSIEKKQIRYQ